MAYLREEKNPSDLLLGNARFIDSNKSNYNSEITRFCGRVSKQLNGELKASAKFMPTKDTKTYKEKEKAGSAFLDASVFSVASEDDGPMAFDYRKEPEQMSVWRQNTPAPGAWVPPMREYSVCALIGRSLWVYGGISAGVGRFNMLAVLDMDKMVWAVPESTGIAPAARAKTSMVVDSHKRLHIFGGEGAFDGEQRIVFNDLYEYGTEERTWDRVPLKARTGLKVPCPRRGIYAYLSGYYNTRPRYLPTFLS